MLAVLCAVLFIGRKTPEPVHVVDPVERSVEKEQLIHAQQTEIDRLKGEVQALRSQEQSRGIDEKAIADYIKSKFPNKYRIPDFKTEVKKLLGFEDYKKYPDNYRDENRFLECLEAYVDFVNNHIREETPQ